MRHASTLLLRPADMMVAYALHGAPTRPRRERMGESKSAEHMDARYARGRTALVRRRERFNGTGSRLPGIFAIFTKSFFKFLVNGFLITGRVLSRVFDWARKASLGPELTTRAKRPTRRAHRASRIGFKWTEVASRVRGRPSDGRTSLSSATTNSATFGGAPQ